ncbi:MAG: ATP-binding protein [Prevotellaceae bacterium]|jgi:predicted AAA+ superfamily ATPase|nr:ATP-binding protein [Prevotellaceae bacterium]
MIHREIESTLFSLLQKYPAVYITGARQSGKTTLVKSLGGDYRYFSFEDFKIRTFAEEDPRGFLDSVGKCFILDEVQRVPALLPYLQDILNNSSEMGQVILVGAHNILTDKQFPQSLAGSVANLTLLPFSYSELKAANANHTDLEKTLFRGGYPLLFDTNIHPLEFFPKYIETYLSRDVRQLKNVNDISVFARFMKLCAGRIGTVLNISALANDADISVNTAKSWLSLMEASYILFFVQPYSGNLNRRLIKMPKMYFYETGLACSLLNIERKKQIENFYMRGNLFENMIFSELIKSRLNKGLPVNFYFLRDAKGNEIDIIIKKANTTVLIEIKASETQLQSHLKNIVHFRKEFPQTENYLIYAGKEESIYNNIKCCNWRNFSALGV